MKTRISVQERLKDLRVERGLNLEELAQKTGISKSALGSYETDNDEYNSPACACPSGIAADTSRCRSPHRTVCRRTNPLHHGF